MDERRDRFVTEIDGPANAIQTAELELYPRTTATLTALELPADLTIEEWADIGRRLRSVVEGALWWLGDWWAYGSHCYGERARIAAEGIGWSFQTCMQAGTVARAFETFRRLKVLSWSHHQVVASLNPADQDAMLELAEREGLSQAKLRQVVRQFRQKANTDKAIEAGVGYVDTGAITVIEGDVLEELARVPACAVALLCTDPPYNVTAHQWDYREDDFWEWTREWLTAARVAMADEHTGFVFCDADATHLMRAALEDTGWECRRQVIWHHRNLVGKKNTTDTLVPTYEVAWHVGTRPLTLPTDWDDTRWDVQIVAMPQSNSVADVAYHPTQKPLELIRRLVLFGSYEGELVLDPFMGSGTTAVACKALDRRCIAIDADPTFVQVARGRLAS
jgi:DNA modification methylase